MASMRRCMCVYRLDQLNKSRGDRKYLDKRRGTNVM